MDTQERDGIVSAQEAFDLAAGQLASGTATAQIRTSLVERGLDDGAAAALVADVKALWRAAARAAGRKNIVVGFAWCAVGIAVTVISHESASPGGRYVIAWGAVVFGAAQCLRGIGQVLFPGLRRGAPATTSASE